MLSLGLISVADFVDLIEDSTDGFQSLKVKMHCANEKNDSFAGRTEICMLSASVCFVYKETQIIFCNINSSLAAAHVSYSKQAGVVSQVVGNW